MTRAPGRGAREARAQAERPACSRRELLGLGVVAGAAALALAAGVPLAACSGPDPLEGALQSFYADREAARAVGAEVLAQEPAKPGAAEWTARVARDRAGELRELAQRDPPALAAALRAQSRDDFAQGRVRVVRGWVLSDTECGLMVLAALR